MAGNTGNRFALNVLGAAIAAVLPLKAAAQQPETVLPQVKVEGARDERRGDGYQPGVTSIGKTPQLLRDIPQSVTIVPEQLIFDRNADTFREALRNVPSLTFNAGEGGRIGDNITLRGYSAVGDFPAAIEALLKAQREVPAGDTQNATMLATNLEKLKRGEDIN